MTGHLKTFFDTYLRDSRWAIIAAWAAIGVIGILITLYTVGGGGSTTPAVSEPPGFSLSPSGDDVSQLAPMKVTFAEPPSEHDGAKVLQLSPAVPGKYAWLSDRTLLFQPDYPGLLRGKTYTLHVAAQADAGLDNDVTRQFTTTGALVVVQTIPADGNTEVPDNAPVLVQFSRSVAPLTLLSARANTPVVTFDPPLDGTGEWLNTSLYRFTPKNMAPNTTYKLTIPAGLTSAADGVLKSDYTWSFTTQSPAISSITPDNGALFGAPRQPVVVVFNQAMDRNSVEAGMKVTAADGSTVPGSVAWSSGSDTVTFTPAQALAPSSQYQVALAAGLKGEHGGATRAARVTSFTTAGKPTAQTIPAAGATDAGRYGISFNFSNPMDLDTLDGKVSVSSFTADQVAQATYTYDQNLYVNLPLKPSTSYTVSFAAGATNRYGQPFPPVTFSFATGALPSSVSLVTPGYGSLGTYASSAEPILYFHATNVQSATFTLYPLTASETMDWMNGKPYAGGVRFQPSLPALRSWTVPVSDAKDVVQILSTSLSGGGNLPVGDYYVRTSGDRFAEMAFSVVNTEIVTKLSSDSLLAWVLDHDTGQPVAGVSVHVDGPGVSPGDAKTGTDGIVSFSVPLPTAPILSTVARQYVLTVDDGVHRGISSTNWQQGSTPYDLGIPQEYYPRQYVGQIFTDRPIYRPGETVNYKGIIRADDDASYSVPPSSVPLLLTITDSKGKQVASGPFTLNQFGSFAGTFQLPADAATGDYAMVIGSGDPKQGFMSVAQVSFLVAEFKVPEFQVDLTTPQDAYVNGATIDVSAKASFYFGGAVAGAPVTWSVISSQFALQVKGYEQYSFADYDYYQQAVVKQPVRATGTATTGADGVAHFNVPAALNGDEGAQQFQISATVTDTNAQAVANSTAVTVHPASIYAGIKPAQYVATAGSDSEVDLVTVDTSGNILPNTPVTVLVYNRTWVTTKTQTPDGARRYDSQPQDTLVATLHTTTDAKGEGHVTYQPKDTGTLRLVAQVADAQGRTEKSATYLWVAGSEFASWQITNDDTIKLVADKDSYDIGDTARVLVPAPFVGATGLITVERGKVITHTVQQFPSNSETISIPIVDHDVPNVFVSVVLYRPPTAEDPVPRYKVGYVELNVSTASRALHVSIQPNTMQAKPGDTVHYDIKVTDADGRGVKAEVSVAVIDKALLSLQQERGIDGLKAFWFERGLGVTTASSLAVSVNRSNDVISEPPAGGKGGGGLDNDRLRQNFQNTAYWNPQLETNANGDASVDVKMPDNLTTWRMDVRAISGGTLVGEGQNELVSTQPLLLRPALPRFLRVGDSVTLRTLVTNATAKSSNVTVKLDAQGVDVAGGTSQTQTIEAGKTATFDWQATVSADGTAKFTFSATGSGGLSDAVVQTLPVYLDVTPETTATGGIVTDTTQTEAVFLPQWAILKGGSVAVSVQASLAGSMADELPALAPATGEYSERIASRLIATIGVRRAEKSAGASTAAYDSRITTDLAALAGQQKNDGGWGWCALCPQSDPNITGWALIALGEGQRDGIAVDPGVYTRATGYIFNYVNRPADVAHPSDPNQKAFLLYGLSLSGPPSQVTAVSAARSLFEQYRSQLNSWGRAYLILALNASGAGISDPAVSALVNDLAAATIPSANGNHWEDPRVEGSFMTNTATTALVLDAMVHADPAHPLVAQTARWLIVARGAQQWTTSIERAQAVLSLSDYAAQTGELAGNFDYKVALDGSSILSGHYAPGQGARTDSITLSLARLRAGAQSIFSFARELATPGRLYYTMAVNYLTPATNVEALNRGFAVSHQYTLLNDPSKPVSEAKLGDTVRVTLTVVVPADRNYVEVDDLLPAGFEPVDPQLKSTNPAIVAQLQVDRATAAKSNEGDYYAPWLPWYYSPWDHVDTRDDRVSLYASSLAKGVYEYVYYARATTPGDFFVAPATAAESYFPDVFGRSDSGRFMVKP